MFYPLAVSAVQLWQRFYISDSQSVQIQPRIVISRPASATPQTQTPTKAQPLGHTQTHTQTHGQTQPSTDTSQDTLRQHLLSPGPFPAPVFARTLSEQSLLPDPTENETEKGLAVSAGTGDQAAVQLVRVSRPRVVLYKPRFLEALVQVPLSLSMCLSLCVFLSVSHILTHAGQVHCRSDVDCVLRAAHGLTVLLVG